MTNDKCWYQFIVIEWDCRLYQYKIQFVGKMIPVVYASVSHFALVRNAMPIMLWSTGRLTGLQIFN